MNKFALYLRSIVFGITDGLVSMVGLLAGIDVAGADRKTVILTGVVYAFVEAFSMAAGNFLSEESAEEYSTRSDVEGGAPVVAGLVMFVASLFAGLYPLVPYVIFNNGLALAVSVIASIAALFVLGLVSARLSRLSMARRGFRMALVGGAAVFIGVAIGLLMPVS